MFRRIATVVAVLASAFVVPASAGASVGWPEAISGVKA